jgi:thioredoxin 1
MGLTKLNAVSFEEVIYDDGESCLVTFSRKSCHVCAEVIPLLEELADIYSGRFGFYSVDIEEQRSLYDRFSLRGVPTVLFFKDGQYEGKLAGLLTEEQVENKIAEVSAK